MSRTISGGAALLAALAALPAGAAGAAGGSLAGKVTGGRVVSGSAGRTIVNAVNVADGEIVASGFAARGGAYRLAVPAGQYVLTTSVVPVRGRVVEAIAPVARVRAGHSTAVRVSLKRKRAPKAVKRRRASKAGVPLARGAAIPPIVAVREIAFRGPGNGPDAQFLGKGLSELLQHDMVTGRSGCEPKTMESMRREEVDRELAFQRSGYTDPKTRVKVKNIPPQITIEGSVTVAADGTTTWDVRLLDRTNNGAAVGGDYGTLPPGGDFVEAAAQIGDRLLDQLCGVTYDVTVAANGAGNFATHSATAKFLTKVVATPGGGVGRLPATWTGQAVSQWDAISITSKTDCAYTDILTGGVMTVKLSITLDGRLNVRWETDQGGGTATAAVDCPPGGPGDPDPPPIPGQPLVELAFAQPQDFELPAAGGSQPINGNVLSGGDGFTTDGVVTVKRNSTS